MLGMSNRAAVSLILGISAIAASCAIKESTAPETTPGTAPIRRETTLLPALLRCDPLPYASASKTIGPAGGELIVGPHRLTIPSGALDTPTVIHGEAPASTAVYVNLTPNGLRFATPSTLTLSYAHCDGSLSLLKTIVQVDDLLNILAVLPSQDLSTGKVSAQLSHFSNYAVAW
jgi:hypothetical protein